MEEKYIASIDLGSSKFGLCVARVNGDDIQIVYYKETPSEGIRYSMIANPLKASQKLKEAVQEAEKEFGESVTTYLDDGTTGTGRPSTIVWISEGKIEIIRQGDITKKQIEDALYA